MIMILKMITLGTGAKHTSRSTCAFIALFYLYVVVVVCWLYLIIMRDSLLSFFFFFGKCMLYLCMQTYTAWYLKNLLWYYGIASADVGGPHSSPTIKLCSTLSTMLLVVGPCSHWFSPGIATTGLSLEISISDHLSDFSRLQTQLAALFHELRELRLARPFVRCCFCH
jgi:hypothetical protein